MKRRFRVIFFSLMAIPLLFLIITGGKWLVVNERDPAYNRIDSLRYEHFYSLADRTDSLQLLFESVQRDTAFKKLKALDIISSPFLPTYEYEKFASFVDHLRINHRAIIAGVTGAGKTTLVDRVSKFFAVDEDQIMRIECVENLEAEYHRNYIGYYSETDFRPGKLLRFFERCQADTLQNFVLVIDDIDKIYPATLFGAAIWNELDNPAYRNGIEGYNEDISIPPNLYLISATHEGPGNTIPLNAEHFRRLGHNGTYPVCFNTREYFLHLRSRTGFSPDMDSLWADIFPLLYFFDAANQLISERYGSGFTLGQWSDTRKMISSADIHQLRQLLISHVNSFNPSVHLQEKDFDGILYSINNNGVIPLSSPVARAYTFVIDVGLFGELSGAIIIGLLSLLAGLFVFYRKRKFIRSIVVQVSTVPEAFQNQQTSYDQARGKLLVMQDAVQDYVLKRKLNFTEANYLLLTINEKLKQMQEYNQMVSVSADFESMLVRFTSDGVLDEKEYSMLLEFLEGIRSTLSQNMYNNLRERIADLYRKSRAKSDK